MEKCWKDGGASRFWFLINLGGEGMLQERGVDMEELGGEQN